MEIKKEFIEDNKTLDEEQKRELAMKILRVV